MFSAVFPANFSSLSPISVLVRDFADRTGFEEKQIYQIELAVDEACSNIIDHAYPGEQKGEIILKMESDQEGLTIILQDQGQPFDPAEIPAPDLTSDPINRRERGLGVFLIHQLMDFVHYEILAGGTNQLTVKKMLHPCPEKPNRDCRDDVLPIEALKLILEINRSISSVMNLDELLAKITDLIQKSLDYPYVHLYIFNFVPQELVYVSGSGERAQYYREKHVTYDINASKGLIPLAAKSRRYYLANDLKNNPWHQPDPREGATAGSELSLPLQFRGELLGVLDIQSDKPGAFEEQDINLLESLAITISVTIRNAQLFKTHEWRRKLAESYRETAELLTREVCLDELFDSILLQIPPLLPVDFVGIWLVDPESGQLVLDKSLKTVESERSFGSMGLTHAEADNWFHIDNLNHEAISKPDQAKTDRIAAFLGLKPGYSAIAAPIISEDRAYGVFTIHTESHGRYGTEARNICSTFADYLAYALDKERLRQAEESRQKTEQELSLARRIQKTFLPETLPQIPGYELAVEWETARQVGGDFYDVIELKDGKVGMLIADVSDKGLPASLYMTVARTLFRAVAHDFTSPAEVLKRVNQLLQLDSTQSFFVTLFYMILEPKSGQLTYSIAGHTPPIVIRPELKEVTRLRRGGIALGILEPIVIRDEYLELASGDSIFLYTDGVSETRDSKDTEYGSEHLLEILRSARNESARELIDLVLKDLEKFRAQESFEDDCTILVLKRK